MGFDMMALMNNRSKAQATAGKYELQKIPIDKMLPNPVNEKIYEVGEIEELAQSILLTGKVLQNAVVTPADENGNHIIIAGHRRRLACQKLVEDGHSEFGEIPCVVLVEQDNLMQELFLIQTNSTARVLTDAEKVRQAERATAILTELKDRKQISGRVRDIAAKMLGTTTGQLARYSAISKGLTNETLRESFESGDMGVSAAYEASRMDEEGQEALAEKIEAGETASIKTVVEERKRAEAQRADVPAEEDADPEDVPDHIEPSTDKSYHQKEPADNTDDEIEQLRELWIRKKAMDEVIKDLQSNKDYLSMKAQAEIELGHTKRARIKRLMVEIMQGYIRMAIDENKELEEKLGDWGELFEQEAHA